jgi:hypothetical protein
MAGRTVLRWVRAYVDGYDMSGYARSLSPLVWTFDEADLTAIGDSGKGYLPAKVNLGIGTINANLDTTATVGSHAALSVPGAGRNVMIAIGDRAEPAAGVPVYMGKFQQASYQAAEDGGAMTATMAFDDYDATTRLNYEIPWGVLSHAKGAETAVNSAAGLDGAAATTAGGYMAYQVFSSNGTATIKIQDSANNTDWLDVASLTTGVTDFSNPAAGIVQIGTTATIRRYTRWQVVFGTADTITFALALVRGR